MTEKNEGQHQLFSANDLKQTIPFHESVLPTVESVCACPDCPYCGNQSFRWHPNQKYCRLAAMLEASRQERAHT